MSQTFTVRECLRGYTNEALGTICEQWQLAANSKASRIRAIDKILQDPLHVKSAAKRLGPGEVRMLHLIAHRGQLSVGDLLNVPGLFSLDRPLQVLVDGVKQGFVLISPQDRSGAFSFSHLNRPWRAKEAGPILVLADLVSKYLPEPVPLGISLPTATGPPDGPPDGNSDKATGAFLETLRVVGLLGPRVTSGDQLHKTDERRALELGREAGLSAESLRLSLMMACELGCVGRKGRRLVTTRKAESWAEQARADRTRDLFQAYLRAQQLPDLELFFPQLFEALEEHLPLGSLRRTYHRTLVAEVLKELPEDEWCPVSGFVVAIHRIDRNLVFLEERWRAIQANAREADVGWKDRQWQLHERRLLLWTIQRHLAGLGMVVLAEEGNLFRLTPLGRYALGVGPVPPDGREPHHDALIVQADFEIIAYLDRCPPDVRRKLDTFCERVRGGIVSTYRLTQESVYRGVGTGTAAAAFVNLLETCGKRPVPANVREQIAAWQRKLETITIHSRCHLLECGDPADAAGLASAVAGSRRVGDRFVLVPRPTKEVSAVIDYRHNRRAPLRQEEGLQLRAPWEQCDLFVRRILGQIGAPETNGRGDLMLRLSPGAIKGNDDWNLLAAQLEALSDKPLAARYRVALRAWAGDLGTARSRNATLVRFEDPEICEAVLELPDVARHVEGRLGLFTLAIHQGQLAQFKKKLKLHGIAVGPATTVVDDQPPEEWAVSWVQEREEPPEETAAPTEESSEAEHPDAEYIHSLPSYSPRIIHEILEDAMGRRRPVLIEYASAWSPRLTVRRVDPVSLDASGPAPSLSGYCHTHKGPRTFKVARITGIRVLEDETF